MLKAYFDESGTHGGAQTALIAGFVGKLEAWDSLEARWIEILAEANLPYFHATEYENHWPLGDVPTEIRPEVIGYFKQQFADAIVQSDLLPVVTAVQMEDWAAVTPEHPEFTSIFPRPYNFCHECVAQSVAAWSETNAGNEPVALVFGEYEKGFMSHVGEIYDAYRNSGVWRDSFWSITFAPSKKTPALQAADMFAYENYLQMNYTRSVPLDQQKFDFDRRLMLSILRAGKRPLGAIYTAAALREVIARGAATRFGVFRNG